MSLSICVLLICTYIAAMTGRALVRSIGWTASSPYLAGSGVLAGMGFLGALMLRPISQHGPILIQTRSFPVMTTLVMFSLAATSFLVGGGFGSGRLLPQSRRLRTVNKVNRASARHTRRATVVSNRNRTAQVSEVSDPPLVTSAWAPLKRSSRRRIVRAAVIGAWAAVTLFVIGAGGIQSVLQRDGYLNYSGPRSVFSLGNAFIAVAPAALGYASALERSRARRVSIYFPFVLIVLLTFSTGSRRFGLAILSFWVGQLLGHPNHRRILRRAPAVAAASLLMVGMSLTTRALPSSGLLPYVRHFQDHPSELVGSLERAGANLLAPFGYNGLMMSEPEIPKAAIRASLSPLPSGAVDYYSYTAQLEFFGRHPYPALGTLNRYGGYRAVVGYMWIAGVIVGLAGRVVFRLRGRASSLYIIAVLGASSYLTLRLASYSLRSSSRLLWYMIPVVVLAHLFILTVRRRPQGKSSMEALERNTVGTSPSVP